MNQGINLEKNQTQKRSCSGWHLEVHTWIHYSLPNVYYKVKHMVNKNPVMNIIPSLGLQQQFIGTYIYSIQFRLCINSFWKLQILSVFMWDHLPQQEVSHKCMIIASGWIRRRRSHRSRIVLAPSWQKAPGVLTSANL